MIFPPDTDENHWKQHRPCSGRRIVSRVSLKELCEIFLFSKTGDKPRFDKPLEEFFSICNQIELHLKTISECVIQQRDAQKYVPFGVNLKSDVSTGVEIPADNSLSYR